MVNVWTTALTLGRPRPTWVSDELDGDRITAYGTYWDLYRSIPEAFTLVMRDDSGEEVSRRYIPSARTIIEATNNYLGKGLKWTAALDAGTPADATAVRDALNALFARERFRAKFASLKRWCLVKGDALLHVTADTAKAEGKRIRITEVSPETYFPIVDAVDPERVVGCYLVQPMLNAKDEQIVSRLFYRRILTVDDSTQYAGTPIGQVFMQLAFFEPDKWDDRIDDGEIKEVAVPPEYKTEEMAPVLEGTSLPAEISALPVYHFRNNYTGSEPFGVSELQGLESLITGINQTMTDEELALVLEGIGVYWTDSGTPVDENGDEVDWAIAPAAVLELTAGSKFGRVQGVTSVQPFQDHKGALHDSMLESSGTPGVATGRVDVQAAQSGIALEIQFRPLTSKNSEKEEEFVGVLNQFLYDLVTGFFPAYEGISPGSPDNPVVFEASFGPALPVNRQEILTGILSMKTAGVIDSGSARTMMTNQLGIEFPADVATALLKEQSDILDATGSRLDAAVTDGTDTGTAVE